MQSKFLKRYLIAGLLVWLPLWATMLVIKFVFDLLDNTVALLPEAYQPVNLIGFNIPGLGIILTIAVLLGTGVIVTNFLGEKLVAWGEKVVHQIPLVGSIYQAVKQVLETIFSTNSQSFRKVLMIEYPRKGLWSIAFQTAQSAKLSSEFNDQEKMAVFVPTTPNPTSGFLILVNKSEVIELDISIDDALKMVISLGVMQPTTNMENKVSN